MPPRRPSVFVGADAITRHDVFVAPRPVFL